MYMAYSTNPNLPQIRMQAVRLLQSDHGAEFSRGFTKGVLRLGIAHRHSRVRQPNDNAHLERWNRTLQEECLIRLPRKLAVWHREIPEYLRYYNSQRPHLDLNMKTPEEKIAEVITRYWLENGKWQASAPLRAPLEEVVF